MGFLADLSSGARGVRLGIDRRLEVEQEHGAALMLVDQELRVMWAVQLMPWRLDLAGANQALLVRDVERTARHQFQRAFENSDRDPAGGLFGPDKPRTADPKWSPVIELRRMSIGGAPAVCVLHRLQYQPGAEHIVARLMIPLASGTLELGAHAVDTMTGTRESALSMLRMEKTGGVIEFLPQAEFDDPRADESFPDHCLSRARRAMRAVFEENAWGIEVLAPMPEQRPGEVVLAESECAITPPPRFVYLPAGTLPMSPTLATFSRIGHCVEHSPDLLDVWKLDQVEIDPRNIGEIERLASATAKGFEREGAKNVITHRPEREEERGRPVVTMRAEFMVDGEAVRAVHCYTVDRDRAVFRVASSTGPHVPWEELRAETRAAMSSWRRLSSPLVSAPPPAQPKKKSWWPFW